MKFARLLLQAFGPFTDAEIDFTAVPSNLHLVYGPNEAGKSSALRAITDLRFGIPLRSPDNFVHAYGDLRISGIFVDANGGRIGLTRRKRRGQTLACFNPADGVELPLAPEHERALTGGLERVEFEAMFGLDHARLREGGRRLLQGEGELGSALFEASAGSRGIAALLAALDADAKQLFNPHGRSQNAVVNSTRHQLDEQRREWRQAQIRPTEWQTLHRDHENAREALAEITEKLQQLRRRDGELAELRSVEPLLRKYDRLAVELETLADIPDLPETAREQRLAAEHARRTANKEWREAEAELDSGAEELEALVIEPSVLEHGEAIERLVAGIEPAARARIEVRRQQAAVTALEDALAEHVARIAPDRAPGDLLCALPSAADRVALEEHLDRVRRLTDRLSSDRQRVTELEQAMAAEAQDALDLADPAALQALDAALQEARKLGDVQRQKAELDRQIEQWQARRDQLLADLNAASIQALRTARPLLEAQIAEAREALAGVAAELRKNRDEDQRLIHDLDVQRVRQRQLAMTGEVVTADTLLEARRRRDAGWNSIRRAYIERCADTEELARGFDPARPLPEAFEQALREADRQVDLLRSDAERAATLADCEERIRQMEARRRELDAERMSLETRRAALERDWQNNIAQAGLPALSPEALVEWQRHRVRALELAESGAEMHDKRERLLIEVATTTAALAAALQAMNHPLPDIAPDDPAARLQGLITHANRCEESGREAAASHKARRQLEKRQRAEQARLVEAIAKTGAEREDHLAALRQWHERLFLPPDSSPDTVKARLDELDRMERTVRELNEARRSQAQQQAVIDDLITQAAGLAARLREPAPESVDSGSVEVFADRLRRRLVASREADQRRKHLLEVQQREQARKHRAQTEYSAQTKLLEQLCAAAGVEAADELPAREDASARKRALQNELIEQRGQLAQSSTRHEAELRRCLADMDTVAIDAERERCRSEIQRFEEQQLVARKAEEVARRALEAVDASDRAAAAREAMESAAARYREALWPWARLRLARALLGEALNRFRDKAQAPMVSAASDYFGLMTGGRYVRLVADESDGKPVLRAERADGRRIGVTEMSEGTADQLYLALRLAALQLRRESHPPMPLVLDDVLVTSDDERAGRILKSLARFAEDDQVLLFTHHQHLIEVARGALDSNAVGVHVLDSPV